MTESRGSLDLGGDDNTKNVEFALFSVLDILERERGESCAMLLRNAIQHGAALLEGGSGLSSRAWVYNDPRRDRSRA
jgi:hypothetical protein